MTDIRVDFNKVIGKIKPMHGVGQPPISVVSAEHFHFLKEAGIPYSRLHDVGGWFGGNLFADIPNIFRDFDADVNNPDSYDFVFTDIVIKGLVENGVEPYFRLGVTIENFHDIKAYRIFPPANFQKWAEICEHIVRHYNEGWANGFRFNITYWEIWNEPDGHHKREENAMWKGTPEEYFQLYKVTSLHLRKCFGDKIKIGGYASCGFYAALSEQTISGVAFGIAGELSDWDERIMGFIRFFNEFLSFVRAENLPFDFFSHHSYGSVSDTLKMQKYCEARLGEAGFENTEIHLNEWNTTPGLELVGSDKACADATAMLAAMQNTKMTLMCYYDARMRASSYGGMFNVYTQKPTALYYGFKMFNELYKLGAQAEITCDNENVYTLAATDGEKKLALFVNTGEDTEARINTGSVKRAFTVDGYSGLKEISLKPEKFIIKQDKVLLLEF